MSRWCRPDERCVNGRVVVVLLGAALQLDIAVDREIRVRSQ